ncbi:hypothetical protein BC826DRAFT_1100692 [Russula brevipes]|nr:hypothetical protein BC826DRAFT_1100692 [Russula brevipes]
MTNAWCAIAWDGKFIIVLGATLGTAAHGAHGSARELLWLLTFAREITGIGVGGEYPASSTSASEAANDAAKFGGPLASSVFLIVLSIAWEGHLHTIWRVCFGVGIVLPLTVLIFRLRMMSGKLYRKGAIKTPENWLIFPAAVLRMLPIINLIYPQTIEPRSYWRPLIGTCGTWFLYDFVTFPNGVFSVTIISSVVRDGDIKKTAEW